MWHQKDKKNAMNKFNAHIVDMNIEYLKYANYIAF